MTKEDRICYNTLLRESLDEVLAGAEGDPKKIKKILGTRMREFVTVMTDEEKKIRRLYKKNVDFDRWYQKYKEEHNTDRGIKRDIIHMLLSRVSELEQRVEHVESLLNIKKSE